MLYDYFSFLLLRCFPTVCFVLTAAFQLDIIFNCPIMSSPSSSCSSSSSMLTSQALVLATAMAVSGTVIFLTLRLQKALADDQIPQQSLRSCISPEGKKKKEKKRVHFAEDVMDTRGNIGSNSCTSIKFKKGSYGGGKARDRGAMPENRVALYNGILRGRVIHRFSYSCYGF